MATKTRTVSRDVLNPRASAQYSRIYQLNRSGLAQPSDYVRRLSDRAIVKSKAPNRTAIPVRSVLRQGCECVSNVSELVQQSNSAMNNYSVDVPQIPTELTSGGVSVSLPQKASAYGSTLGQWTIGITNNSGAAQELVIGDFYGLIGDYKGVGVLPPTVVIDGTFGSDTLAQMKVITGDTPAYLIGLHIEADDKAFFTGGRISNIVASLTDSSPDEGQVHFNKLATGATYNPEIREDEYYGFQVAPNSGIYVRIQDGRSVQLTWDVLAFGTTFLMNRIGA